MRSAEEVFHDHLAKRKAGKVEEDIKNNYADHVIVLSGHGIFKGHSGVRQSAEKLAADIGESEFAYQKTLVEGPYAFLEWAAKGKRVEVRDGADSFVIEDGKIVLQTVHYTPIRVD